MIVEICANSFESALTAEKGGAHRIELCTQLAFGGLTPSRQLIKKVKSKNLIVGAAVGAGPDEIKRAEELLKKAKQQHVNTGMLKTLNQFKTLV